MKSHNRIFSTIKFMAAALALTLTLVSGLSANTNGSGSSEKAELSCRVEGSYFKHVLVTNHTDRVIAKDTPISFDSSTGVETTVSMPKNLKPGRTAIIYSGAFKPSTCKSQIKQQ